MLPLPVSFCSMMEIREGRGCGPKGDYVLLKLDHLSLDIIKERLPGIAELARTFANVDVMKEPIPVVPTCHYMMGGIPTNFNGQVVSVDAKGKDVVIPGLFAAGECASVSVHGANRLGANSLLDIVVFGRAIGIYLSEHLEKNKPMPVAKQADIDAAVKRVNRLMESTQGEHVHAVREDMQKAMEDHFGVFRDHDSMQEGLEKLKAVETRAAKTVLLDKSKAFNTALIEALELDNLIACAKMSAICANERTESRGAHSRLDFPERDDKNWHKHSIIFEDERLASRPVNMKPNKVDPIKLQPRVE